MMRVIHVITRLDRGGSAENTIRTVLGHDRARFEPIVVAGWCRRWTDQGGDEATRANLARLEAGGVRTIMLDALTREIHPVRDARACLELWRLFRRERPTIVHTHTSKAGALGRLAARLAGVPLIVHTPHGHVFYGFFGGSASRVLIWIERGLARLSRRMIALTAAERDEHLALRIGRADRFAVVPSGIDLGTFRAIDGVRRRDLPGLAPLPADARVIGAVGWLTPVKGHRTLLNALARVRRRHPEIHALIIGTGVLKDALQAQARSLGIDSAVHWLGARTDVPDCLALMDVFVQPSLNEGMGRALVEAMAAGRPVIASRVGGVPAIIQDRKTGLLVAPGDVDALSAALLELLDNPGWAKELAAAGRASIGEEFGAASMVRAIETVYAEALREVGRA